VFFQSKACDEVDAVSADNADKIERMIQNSKKTRASIELTLVGYLNQTFRNVGRKITSPLL
jgi:hypothetical protein